MLSLVFAPNDVFWVIAPQNIFRAFAPKNILCCSPHGSPFVIIVGGICSSNIIQCLCCSTFLCTVQTGMWRGITQGDIRTGS